MSIPRRVRLIAWAACLHCIYALPALPCVLPLDIPARTSYNVALLRQLYCL
jgi:hypothetical protein